MASSSTASANNSGASTPRIDRTDSVVNLTKPSLYGIYNDNSLLNLNSVNDSDYDINQLLKKELETPNSKSQNGGGSPSIAPATLVESKGLSKLPVFIKVIILSLSAFVYNEITKHINYQHFATNELANFPLTVTNVFVFSVLEKLKLGNYFNVDGDFVKLADFFFAVTVQGLIMGLIQPIMDKVLPANFSKRLLSSNPFPHAQTTYSNLFNDLLRASVTFLGISYAIRKIEWSSFLQVSIIWSLMNPGLWLLLDGTLSGFLSSTIVSLAACGIVYFENYVFVNQYYSLQQEDSIAVWLWVCSFFFCGLIIFGKIGRGLFGGAKAAVH